MRRRDGGHRRSRGRHRARDPDCRLRVRSLAAGDEARWDAFVDACAPATFFHRAGWRDILENVFRHRCHYLIAERGDAICGVLPMAEIRSRLFGHALVSLPFCVYGGPAATIRSRERTDRCCGRTGTFVARRSPRASEPRAEAPRLALPGPVRDLPQDTRTRCRDEHARDPAQAARDGPQGHRAGPARRDRRHARPLLRALRRQHAPARLAGAVAALFRAALRARSARPASA